MTQPKAILYPKGHPIALAIDSLRQTCIDNGYIFGCAFIAERTGEGLTFGVFFADDYPKHLRNSMLDDAAKAIEAARKL